MSKENTPPSASVDSVVMPWSSRAEDLRETEGPYADYAAWSEWFSEWLERQPVDPGIYLGETEKAFLYAAFVDALSGSVVRWRPPSELPGCGDSIWIAVLEHDGFNIHVDYSVTWWDTDGLLVHRYEGERGGYGENWPPKDVLAWLPCEVPQYRR